MAAAIVRRRMLRTTRSLMRFRYYRGMFARRSDCHFSSAMWRRFAGLLLERQRQQACHRRLVRLQRDNPPFRILGTFTVRLS